MKTTFLWLTLFSIAMGFLESAVVVYLREIYYPNGFGFPLVALSGKIAFTELLREVATVIMLIAAGYLGGQFFRHRFAWFIYCFGIWDIFYYVFLKVLLNWPETWLTWDLLFLIPVPWTGPVLAPIIASLTMILMAWVILKQLTDKRNFPWNAWLPVITGTIVIFISFIWDYMVYLSDQKINVFFQFNTMQESLIQYIPDNFKWAVFLAGELIILIGLLNYWRTERRLHQHKTF